MHTPGNVSVRSLVLFRLFFYGINYGTVAGYKCMLSSFLGLIENVPVSQYPLVIILLVITETIFNLRPSKVKLVPNGTYKWF